MHRSLQVSIGFQSLHPFLNPSNLPADKVILSDYRTVVWPSPKENAVCSMFGAVHNDMMIMLLLPFLSLKLPRFQEGFNVHAAPAGYHGQDVCMTWKYKFFAKFSKLIMILSAYWWFCWTFPTQISLKSVAIIFPSTVTNYTK